MLVIITNEGHLIYRFSLLVLGFHVAEILLILGIFAEDCSINKQSRFKCNRRGGGGGSNGHYFGSNFNRPVFRNQVLSRKKTAAHTTNWYR